MFSSRPSFATKKNTGYSFGGSLHSGETSSTFDSKSGKGGPLLELRHALDRIEAIVKQARLDWDASQTSGSSNDGVRSSFSRKGIGANRRRREKRSKSAAVSPTATGDDSPTSGSRSRTRQRGSDQRTNRRGNASFICINHSDEEELIELLRRAAELVVTGERAAAMALSSEGDDDGGMDEADSHIALFEHFCERNALPLIVNIVTGAAFSPSAKPPSSGANGASDSDSDSDPMELTLLPPVTVATQSIQSVSILIQNVSRATSLYFLLSNNRINDLINFPLGLYAAAEQAARGNLSDIGRGGHVGKKDECSPEMGELSARFVSFLKSLAMRMNAETLQFFLKYPPQQRRRMSEDEKQNEAPSDAGGEDCTDDERDNDSTAKNKLSGKNALIDFPLSSTDGDSSNEEEKDSDEKLSPQQKPLPDPVSLGLTDVEFPLYARALEFCSSEQDSFVRVTAMNICLNTLRLSSYDGKNDNEQESDSDGAPDSPSSSSAPMSLNPAMMNTPDGTLHNTDALPLRERVAIARHVCDPNRVEGLVSPIFAKLAGLCGSLEETIRSIDEANEVVCNQNDDSGEESSRSVSSGSVLASDDEQKWRRIKQRKKRRRRKDKMVRLTNDFKDISADLQDELMLLEDVLKVGLTSMNEQTIEMMMATFIYPLLLQPLLYLQRCNLQNRPFLDAGREPLASMSSRSSLDSSDPTNRSETVPGKSMNSLHPFSAETLSTALARSGLLNEESDPIVLRLPSMENDQPPSTGESISDTDMAPVKTAFVGLAAVFHTVTHQPLLRLLLTALFHPLAPAASGGVMIRSEPNVVCSGKDGNLHVRVDGESTSLDKSRVGLGKIYGTGIYTFGKISREQSCLFDARNLNGVSNNDSSSVRTTEGKQPLCTFVLSPALADILNASKVSASSASARWRENPYRRIVLACLAGIDGMLSLRSISVLAMDAAMSALDVRSMDIILFGKNMNNVLTNNKALVETDHCDAEAIVMPTDESRAILSESTTNDSTNDPKTPMKSKYIVEVIAALSFSVITAQYSVKGVWKLDFDQIAADALVRATEICPSAATIAAKLLDHRRLQSASFVSKLPSLLHLNNISSSPKDTKGEKAEDEEQLDVIMDRIFFDLHNESNRCVVEKLLLDREQRGSNVGYGQFRAPITTRISLNNVCVTICKDMLDENDIFSSEKERSLRFAAISTFSHLQLDSFAKYINNRSRGLKHAERLERNNLGGNTDRGEDGVILAHVSEHICTSILESGKNSDVSMSPSGEKAPIPGSTVELVGRAAFPCVCEVSESSATLFSAHGATVSEGVTWQSLYLVVLGKYMILAEPESGSSEGNGRIVMSCRLSCLTVEKDKPINANNGSTACRLILSHASHESQPPGVFNVIKIKTNDNDMGTRFTHCRMDVWFEDGKAAAHAFKVLALKIFKAKSNRGSKIREALTLDGQLQSSSLFKCAG